MNEAISRLTRIPLRTVWPHEAQDFTHWMQRNIDVVGKATNLSLANVEREQSAGAFSVDLVAEDEAGAKVIIENQLGRSDHDHLGKVLTYLSAMNARAAIWIVADPRPEHVAAMSWLNESSTADFYLLKVEAVRIGDSPPAPLVTKIVGPSSETKAVSATNREFAERYDLREKWWSALLARPAAHMHAHLTPGRYGWVGLSSGVRGVNLNYSVLQNESRVEIYIDRGKEADEENLIIFDKLSSEKDDIEAAFGGELKWERLEESRACRISTGVEGGYKTEEEGWDEVQDNLIARMNKLEKALRPHLNRLELPRQ